METNYEPSDVEISDGGSSGNESSDEDMRAPSPIGSVISFNSGYVMDLLRECNGRLLSSQNEKYIFPVDREEHERAQYQHRLLQLTLDSLYAAPDLVRAAMAPNQMYAPAAVDIGTGSGQWAIEFAKEFPHADVVGIDLAPPTLKGHVPSNCRFELDNVNLPLPHFYESFNLCHMRCLEYGIDDYEELIYRVAGILRTNGVLLLVAGDAQFFAEDKSPLPVDAEEGQPGWCAFQALFWALRAAALSKGGSGCAPEMWDEWLSKNPYYTAVGMEDIFIPVGPWMYALDRRCTYIAQLMQINTHTFIAGLKTLLKHSLEESILERWITLAHREVTEMKPRIFSRWRYAWAIRNSIPMAEDSC